MRTSWTSARSVAAAALLAAVLAGTAACSSDGAPAGDVAQESSATTLDAAAFGERVAEPDVVVLDVRTPEEFAAGHLPGAVNANLESGTFTDDLAALDPAATYAVYCRSGNRSAQALGIMQDAGFDDVAHLDGGIAAWAQAGGVVVTD
ncbi:MAG TPA: rhodanese-like domain-containing protein [Actinotalea sp.]|nr:rhodanese-like domain-containing protein [Actinotalea sp.]